MKIWIEGKLSNNPKSRAQAIEACARTICEMTGQDPADAVMMLLTAAAHMTSVYSKKPVEAILPALAESLGHASIAAEDFFKLKDASRG